MKNYRTLIIFIVGIGIGVFASILYTRTLAEPRIEEPEFGGVFDVSFWSNENLRLMPTKLIGDLQEYEIITKWSFRNNSDSNISLAIPRQKFWVMYSHTLKPNSRTESINRLGELKVIPEECIREEGVMLQPGETYEIIQVQKGVFTEKPETGLNDVIKIVAKIGEEYQILSCRNRTTL